MASSTPASSAAQLRQICGVGQCWGPTSHNSVPWGFLQPSSSLVQVSMRRWHTLQALPGTTGFTWQEPSLSSLRPVCRTNPCRLWVGKADTSKACSCSSHVLVPAQPQVAIMQGQQNSSPLCPHQSRLNHGAPSSAMPFRKRWCGTWWEMNLQGQLWLSRH